MAKCNGCGKFLASTGAACCSVCSSMFHKPCVSLPDSNPVHKNWVCPGCKTRTRKEDNTPVRGVVQDSRMETMRDVSPPCTYPAAARATALSSSPAAPAVGLQDVHQELSEWMMEIREFRQEMTEFRSTVLGITARMDDFERRLVVVEQRREESAPEVADLQSTVLLLQRELADRDQDALLSDLEIGNLPEERSESVVHTVTVLAAKLGVSLDERDIVFAERVGTAQGAGAGGGAPRDRRVVVRLARRSLRDQMLGAARVRRTITAADAGRDAGLPPARIYINERLTRANRQLFHRVREECRRLQWRYSWTKRGRIYARQGDGKQAYPIRTEMDLNRVFGLNCV